MSARVFARALHTSRVTLEATADAAASAARPAKRPNRAPRPNMNPKDPKNLGFSGTTRTRALPSLDLPSSSRRPVRRDQQQKQEATTEAPQGTVAAEGEAARAAAAAPLETPIEFFEGSQFAPNVEGVERMSLVNDRAPREPRAPRGPRPPRTPRTGTEGGGDRQQRGPRPQGQRGPAGLFVKKAGGAGGAGGAAKRNDNRRGGRGDGKFSSRGKEDEGRVMEARAKPFERETRDTSPGNLFGRSSIVAPAESVGRSADPALSFWAKGMEPVDARKTDILRLYGAYEMLLPAAPKKGETGADAARSAAIWNVGMNPTMSMRKADKLTGILKTML